MVGNFGGSPSARNDKTKIVIGVLVFAVLGFAFVLFSALKKQPENVIQVTDAAAGNIKILYPVQKIDRGSALDASMFEFREVASDSIPDGVITDFQSINGKYAKVDIIPRQGQPLIEEYISIQKPVELSAMIPNGYRAVTIRVDDVSSIEGWARPGAKVDVLWTTNVAGQKKLVTLVENAEVVSMDGSNNSNQINAGKTPGTVTLSVTEEDSRKVILASSSGNLSLVLRNERDEAKNINNSTLDQTDILGNKQVVQVEQKPAIPQQVCTGTVEMGGEKYCVSPSGKLEPFKE